MLRPTFLACAVAAIAYGAAAMNPTPAPDPAFNPVPRKPDPASASARAVVEAMNALVPSDIGIMPAAAVPCDVERLPGTFAQLVTLVPPEHRQLLEECAGGRMRVRRRLATFEPLALLDEPPGEPLPDGANAAGDRVATIRAFFSGRPVDVARGSGLSDGPYEVSFDWAVVLDPRSQTLFSFVVNCRD